jgi:monoamine oxidase
MSKLSRRQIVAGLLNSSIESATTSSRATDKLPGRSGAKVDVCVIGAGLAGLTAAFRLKRAGAEVAIFEARERVGGRAFTQHVDDGGWMELGAQWIGPTQDRIAALIKELGCETYRSPNFGKTLQLGLFDKRKYHRLTPNDERYPGASIVNAGFDKLDNLAKSINSERPWEVHNAEILDSTTLHQWLKRNIRHKDARQFVGTEVCSIVCANAEEISLLHTLFLIKSCHGLDMLFGDEGSAQQDCLIGGTQRIAQQLAQRLGGVIRFGEPARRIKWSDTSAIVSSDKTNIETRHVIVAVPPSIAGALDYEPSLPTSRVQVTQRWPQGVTIKVQMVYNEPFWRRCGLNGASYDYESVLTETADSSVPEAYSRLGILSGFVYCTNARNLATLTAEQRKKVLLLEASKRFGPKAMEPIGYVEANWSIEPWTRGCPSGFLTPGATVLFRSAVRDSVGPMHWAGTETATIWPSFMEGAVTSGERAADEILQLTK